MAIFSDARRAVSQKSSLYEFGRGRNKDASNSVPGEKVAAKVNNPSSDMVMSR